MYKIVLASGSPRRQEILKQLGVSFTIMPSDKEEKSTYSQPSDLVKDLSYNKAEDISKKVTDSSIIIGADTVVALKGEILGKPKSKEDAYNMIECLQGKEHQVYTGVSVLINEGYQKKSIQFAECTDVVINPMTHEEINRYINTDEPYDKAGGYAIQGLFAVHVKEIRGDYYNVVGFPIGELYKRLMEEGIDLFQHII